MSLEEDRARLRQLAEQSAALEGVEVPSTELALRTAEPEELRRQVAAAQAQVVERRREAEAVHARVKAELTRQAEAAREELSRAEAEMREVLAPLQAMMKQLEEGIWTINLYLGTTQRIKALRGADFRAASAEEPITMRQLVLAMDEETAINPEEDGIDFRNVEGGEFDAWLLADPRHVEQVIPEPKGVVALVPRWRSKEHEDPWMQKTAAERDAQTYFLIRNGEQLYRTWADFNVGRQLLPKRTELVDFFTREVDGERVALNPESEEWGRAADAADARQRHYMRVALILEGLIHRTTVFRPFHPWGVSFLDPDSARDGRIRFIMDGDESRLLAPDREPFFELLKRLNAQLRPGMRVVLNPHGLRQEGWNLSGGRGWHNPRLYPDSLYGDLPEEGKLYTIEERRANGDLVIRWQRMTEVYDPDMWVVAPDAETDPRRPAHVRPEHWGHRGGYRLPKTRASATLRPTDRFVIPFDLITEEQALHYLGARLERHQYAFMFPVLKSVVTAKREERAAEAPFREMLSGVLARENGGTVAEAEARVDGLIDWFKFTNSHHRPLYKELPAERVPSELTPGGRRRRGAPRVIQASPEKIARERAANEEFNAGAVRLIVAEDARRLREGPQEDKHAPRLVEEHGEKLLALFRKRGGDYVALESAGGEPYVHRFTYAESGRLRGRDEWWTPTPGAVNRWRVIKDTEAWRAWNFTVLPADRLTGPEREAFLAFIQRMEPELLAVLEHERDPHRWDAFVPSAWKEPRGSRRTRRGEREYRTDYVAVGFVYRWSRKGGRLDMSHSDWQSGTPVLRSLPEGAVWADPVRWERAEAAQAVAAAEEREKRALDGRVGTAYEMIISARLEWERQLRFAKFMEEFGEPALWEGHLQANPLPHRRDFDDDTVRTKVREAVVAGRVLGGVKLTDLWPEAPHPWNLLAWPEREPEPVEDEREEEGDPPEDEIEGRDEEYDDEPEDDEPDEWVEEDPIEDAEVVE